MEKAMVRYGVLNNDRKDTLYTFRAGEHIFFGIARCNLKAGDKFDRELGKKIAMNRALKAKELVDSGQASVTEAGKLDDVTWNVSYGCVPVGDVKSLLNYFHTLRTTVRL
jgi:hypothetical protein